MVKYFNYLFNHLNDIIYVKTHNYNYNDPLAFLFIY